MRLKLLVVVPLVACSFSLAAMCIISVGPDMQAARLQKYVRPVYPEEARKAGIVGEVVVSMSINGFGRVSRADVVSGPRLLRKPVVDAVRQWTYRPWINDGMRHKVESGVTIHFNAEGAYLVPLPMEPIYAGIELTDGEAANLEQTILADPNNEATRLKLLAYYAKRRDTTARRKTLIWLLENHPESTLWQTYVTTVHAHGDTLSDSEGFAALKTMWLNHPRLASNRQIRLNAISKLMYQDKETAASLAADMPEQLGRIYAYAVTGFIGYGVDGARMFEPVGDSPFEVKAAHVLAAPMEREMTKGAYDALQGVNDGKWTAKIKELAAVLAPPTAAARP